MERTMSVEDKIKRAEEIYQRRKGTEVRYHSSRVHRETKKDFKLLKKMVVQIIICLAIYTGYYLIHNNKSIFSEDVLNRTKEVLSYDISIPEIYTKAKERWQGLQGGSTEKQEGIGGAVEQTEQGKIEEQPVQEQKDELSQMEKDSIEIKNAMSLIKPVEGTISSQFGLRNPSTSSVPKNHTGTDIAASTGTVIRSATDGEVVLSSSEGDYRKSFENTKWRGNYYLCSLSETICKTRR